jgi:hypothetical protein
LLVQEAVLPKFCGRDARALGRIALRRAAASSRHIFQNNQLASHPGGASAHGSPGLANGGSCDAHAVYSGSTSAAGGRDFRDHAVWLRNWRRCHRLRRYCNRQGEASSGDQSNHSLLPNSSNHSDLLRKAHGLAHKLTARLLEDLR